MRAVLLLDERILPDGGLARTWVERVDGDRVEIRDEGLPQGAPGSSGTLSIAALERVMRRYGKPLDPEVALDGEALELGDGLRLRRLRFHAVVDAMGRDYLVWERDREEPLAAIARMVTAALRYLVLRLHDDAPQESEG
jgi:hypothetical protein